MEDDFEQSDNSQLSSPMSQSNDEKMEEDFPYEHCEGNFSFLFSLIDLGRAIGPFLLHSLRLFAIKSAKSVSVTAHDAYVEYINSLLLQFNNHDEMNVPIRRSRMELGRYSLYATG